MASRLTDAHIEAQARLRRAITDAAGRVWTGLGNYDEDDVPRFLNTVLPVVKAGQRQSMALTEVYMARFLGRQPLGLDPDELTGAAVRNGTPPETVYRRPFVQVWSGLQAGTLWADAVAAGRARVRDAAAMDMQLTMRATMAAVARRYG